jgi:hypothetical protein
VSTSPCSVAPRELSTINEGTISDLGAEVTPIDFTAGDAGAFCAHASPALHKAVVKASIPTIRFSFVTLITSAPCCKREFRKWICLGYCSEFVFDCRLRECKRLCFAASQEAGQLAMPADLRRNSRQNSDIGISQKLKTLFGPFKILRNLGVISKISEKLKRDADHSHRVWRQAGSRLDVTGPDRLLLTANGPETPTKKQHF